MANLDVNWTLVSDSFLKTEIYRKTEILNDENNVFSMKSIYCIKDLDVKKHRFAKNTLISKNYEQSLDKNLIKWAKIFKINTEGL